VDSERYLLTLMRYIEVNPVRAGMVTEPGDYPWSSDRRHAQGESGPNADWLMPHPEYRKLGKRNAARKLAYRQLFHAAISDAELAEIRDCSRKGWALGCERFKAQIEILGQRRATSKGVGRARKENNRV
jgi:putative transposase